MTIEQPTKGKNPFPAHKKKKNKKDLTKLVSIRSFINKKNNEEDYQENQRKANRVTIALNLEGIAPTITLRMTSIWELL